MKPLFRILPGLIILSSLFVSCHKYSEDPFISFRKPQARLRGIWNITSYQIYGKEHGHDFDSLLSPINLYNRSVSFDAGTNGQDWGTFTFQNMPVCAYDSYVEYRFDDVDALAFTYDYHCSDTTFYNLFFYGSKNPNFYIWPYEWKIVELYGKNFHISRDGIDIYFKKQ